MVKVARISKGVVTDVFEGTVEEAEKLHHPDTVSRWKDADEGFVEVPETVLHGARVAGDEFINPAPRLPIETTLEPVVFNKPDFMDYCSNQLSILHENSIEEGVKRFGHIIRVASDSDDDGVFAAIDRYKNVTTVEKASAVIFFNMLLQANIVTQEEVDAVLENWVME